MKQFVGVTVALAALMIGQASAQERGEGAALTAGTSLTTDPQMQIYRFTGLRDNGGAVNAGTATVLHCTNFSGSTETLRLQIRQFTGTVVKDNTFNVTHNYTFTIATHGVAAFA